MVFTKKTILCLSRSVTCPGHRCAVIYISEGTINGREKKKKKKKNPVCATRNTSVYLGCVPEKHLSVREHLRGWQRVAALPGAGQRGFAVDGESGRTLLLTLPLQHPHEMLFKAAPLGESRFDRS